MQRRSSTRLAKAIHNLCTQKHCQQRSQIDNHMVLTSVNHLAISTEAQRSNPFRLSFTCLSTLSQGTTRCKSSRVTCGNLLKRQWNERICVGLPTVQLLQERKFRLFDRCGCPEEAPPAQAETGDEDLVNDQALHDEFSSLYLLPDSGHRVLVIQPDIKWGPRKQQLRTAKTQLDEACALVQTLPKWTVVDTIIQSVKHPNKKEVFGTGTFLELKKRVRSKKNVTAIFMGLDVLTPIQLDTLQKAWRLPVFDRYAIVLQIFKQHARTKEARLQVALAEVPYLRSRLPGLHDGSLDQQRGAIGYIGGAGETFLETRRRLLQERESKLKKALNKVKTVRQILKQERKKKEFPVVAVVGYTNCGKTSLIKALTKDQALQPKNQLFATLDVTAHAGRLQNNLTVLYIDTVGFISDIPTSLIASFSATLEDALEADVIVHVRDISHPDTLAQKDNVLATLANLRLSEEQTERLVEVCNKVDLLPDSHREELTQEEGPLYVSATTGQGLAELSSSIQEAVMESTGRLNKCLRVPMSGPQLSWLYKEATVEDTQMDEQDTEHLLVNVIMSQSVYAKYQAMFGKVRQKTR